MFSLSYDNDRRNISPWDITFGGRNLFALTTAGLMVTLPFQLAAQTGLPVFMWLAGYLLNFDDPCCSVTLTRNFAEFLDPAVWPVDLKVVFEGKLDSARRNKCTDGTPKPRKINLMNWHTEMSSIKQIEKFGTKF